MGKAFRDRETILGTRDDMAGISAIPGAAGKFGIVAEIFAAGQAIATLAAAGTEPGDPDPVTHREARYAVTDLHNPADNLVPRNDGIAGIWDFPVGDMKVGAAHAAGKNLDQYLVGTRRGHVSRDRAKRPARAIQLHCTIFFPPLLHLAVMLLGIVPPENP